MLPQPGDRVACGVDLGLTKDSAALVMVHQRGESLIVAEIVELRPTRERALRPSELCQTFADIMRAHGCSYAYGDQYYRHALVEVLENNGFSYAEGPSPPSEAYVRARTLMREGRVRLPNHKRLLQQLRETVGVATSGGRLSIQHPRKSNGGHGDIADALCLALWGISGDLIPMPDAEMGTAEWAAAQRDKRQAKHRERMERPGWMANGDPVDRGGRAGWRR